MSLKEEIHKIKNEMRKRITDEQLLKNVVKLLKLEDEIRRNVGKALKNNNHELQFTSGDLRIISTCMNTKMTRWQKKLYYESIVKNIKEYKIVTDSSFTEVINQSISDYTLFKKLSDCHYLLGTMTMSVELIEEMRKQGI